MLKHQDSSFEDEDLWDEESDSIENSYLIVSINSDMYAFKLEQVREIIKLPHVQTYPEMSEYERGFIKLRNDIVRIIDLRNKLKYQSFAKEEHEFLNNLNSAKQTHIDWINTLEDSLNNNIEFNLQTDHQKCNFGVWLDNFRTQNRAIQILIKQLEIPHKKLHQLGERVKSLQSVGRLSDAMELIKSSKLSTLKTFFEIIESAQSNLEDSRREVAIIFSRTNQLVGCTADSVLNIIEIQPEDIEPSNRIESKDYVSGIAKTKEGVILIIDDNKLI